MQQYKSNKLSACEELYWSNNRHCWHETLRKITTTMINKFKTMYRTFTRAKILLLIIVTWKELQKLFGSWKSCYVTSNNVWQSINLSVSSFIVTKCQLKATCNKFERWFHKNHTESNLRMEKTLRSAKARWWSSTLFGKLTMCCLTSESSSKCNCIPGVLQRSKILRAIFAVAGK